MTVELWLIVAALAAVAASLRRRLRRADTWMRSVFDRELGPITPDRYPSVPDRAFGRDVLVEGGLLRISGRTLDFDQLDVADAHANSIADAVAHIRAARARPGP